MDTTYFVSLHCKLTSRLGAYIWVVSTSWVDPGKLVDKAGADEGVFVVDNEGIIGVAVAVPDVAFAGLDDGTAADDDEGAIAGAVVDPSVAVMGLENATDDVGMLVIVLLNSAVTDALLGDTVPLVLLGIIDTDIALLVPDWTVGMKTVPVGPSGIEATMLCELEIELEPALSGSLINLILCQLPLLSEY